MRRKILYILLILITCISWIHNIWRWLNWNILQWNDVGISALECSLQNESEQDMEFGYYALDMIFGGISIDLIINMIFDMLILVISLFLICGKSQKK